MIKLTYLFNDLHFIYSKLSLAQLIARR